MFQTEEILDCDASGLVPVRVHALETLSKTPPLVLHLHGGHFMGGANTSGERSAAILAAAGAVVISVDYADAAARPFPAPLELVFDVFSALKKRCSLFASRRSLLFVAGEEAGGNLAAGVALMARDRGETKLQGQMLLSPMLDPTLATSSIRRIEAAGKPCAFAAGWNRYLGSAAKACHPYAAPALSRRLSNVAPALIVTAQDDPLRDESLAYAARLRQSGVTVRDLVLPAPTGWPASLSETTPEPPIWQPALQTEITAFLEQTGALPPRDAGPAAARNPRHGDPK
ncbi:alpha/beta hydrolase [Thioclava sp. BHET1]|nr:alpha/beta hydrolase [Thioclava sp. BHET1]